MKRPVIAVVFIFIGLFIGFLFPGQLTFRNFHPQILTFQSTISRNRTFSNNYNLIDPLLGVEVGQEKDFTEFKPFQNKLNNLLNQLQNQNKVTAVSLYFRNFKNAHYFGTNEAEKFYPGSLLKVPLMISYLEQAEFDSSLLEKKFTWDGKTDANHEEFVKPVKAIQAGQPYTVQQLLEYMIEYSDNNAANLLVANLDQNSFNAIYNELGINLPDEIQMESDFITAQQYAMFFRVLRNATILNEYDSQKALQMLTQTDYNSGLAAGVPQGTVVAHKFGEHLLQPPGSGGVEEFHDCGIVYAPSGPYLLCVMTKGQSYSDLQNSIKQISQLVYQEVTNNFQ